MSYTLIKYSDPSRHNPCNVNLIKITKLYLKDYTWVFTSNSNHYSIVVTYIDSSRCYLSSSRLAQIQARHSSVYVTILTV